MADEKNQASDALVAVQDTEGLVHMIRVGSIGAIQAVRPKESGGDVTASKLIFPNTSIQVEGTPREIAYDLKLTSEAPPERTPAAQPQRNQLPRQAVR
jgi:hypothetical protein